MANLISQLAPHFERYITLNRVHPSKVYHYKARDMFDLPVFEITPHKPKCGVGSWLYTAVVGGSMLESLQAGEKLYVGSQTADRMFRGDGLGGTNFHHAQMRSGNGVDTPQTLMNSGKSIDIYRISGEAIKAALGAGVDAPDLRQFLSQQTKRHVGYWVEQYVLHTERGQWRWNTASADRTIENLT